MRKFLGALRIGLTFVVGIVITAITLVGWQDDSATKKKKGEQNSGKK